MAESDLDLIAVLNTRENVQEVVQQLPDKLKAAWPILASAYTDRFPWFRRLWTFYFDMAPLFAVDLGILVRDEMSDFYVEPDAVIVRDLDGSVAARKQDCYAESIEGRARLRDEIQFEVFHTTCKLEKAIRKGSLWKAFEHVNVLRRAMFRALRERVDAPEYVHVGKPERDIEQTLPSVAHQDWSDTIPEYTPESIVGSALSIVMRIKKAIKVPTAIQSEDARLMVLAAARLSSLMTRHIE